MEKYFGNRNLFAPQSSRLGTPGKITYTSMDRGCTGNFFVSIFPLYIKKHQFQVYSYLSITCDLGLLPNSPQAKTTTNLLFHSSSEAILVFKSVLLYFCFSIWGNVTALGHPFECSYIASFHMSFVWYSQYWSSASLKKMHSPWKLPNCTTELASSHPTATSHYIVGYARVHHNHKDMVIPSDSTASHLVVRNHTKAYLTALMQSEY